jgi:DNA-binding response OmpR family regulator
MPLAGDGFTLVSAMRHTHPRALTMVLSGYPALDEAMSAIASRADAILAKPIGIAAIKELIRTRLAAPRSVQRLELESVSSILDRETVCATTAPHDGGQWICCRSGTSSVPRCEIRRRREILSSTSNRLATLEATIRGRTMGLKSGRQTLDVQPGPHRIVQSSL